MALAARDLIARGVRGPESAQLLERLDALRGAVERSKVDSMLAAEGAKAAVESLLGHAEFTERLRACGYQRFNVTAPEHLQGNRIANEVFRELDTADLVVPDLAGVSADSAGPLRQLEAARREQTAAAAANAAPTRSAHA